MIEISLEHLLVGASSIIAMYLIKNTLATWFYDQKCLAPVEINILEDYEFAVKIRNILSSRCTVCNRYFQLTQTRWSLSEEDGGGEVPRGFTKFWCYDCRCNDDNIAHLYGSTTIMNDLHNAQLDANHKDWRPDPHKAWENDALVQLLFILVARHNFFKVEMKALIAKYLEKDQLSNCQLDHRVSCLAEEIRAAT